MQQFKKIVFPGIVARATGQQSEEDDMPTPEEIWAHRIPIPDGREVSASTILAWTDNRHNVIHGRLVDVEAKLDRLAAAVEALAKLNTTKEA